MTWFKRKKSEKKKQKEFADKIRGKEEDKIVKPVTYYACTKEYMKNSPESKVGIAKYSKTGSAQNAKTLTIQEMDKLKDTFEEFIRENYGGGDFRIAFLSPEKEIQATYELSILGPDIKLGKKNKEGDESSNGKKKKSSDMVMAMWEREGARNDVLMKMIIEGANSGSPMEEIMSQFFLKFADNGLLREQNALGSATDILKLMNETRPQIAAEDSSTAMIQAAAQVLPALINAIALRGAGQQALPQQPQQQALPPAAVAQLTEALKGATPEQVKQFAPLLQGLTAAQPTPQAIPQTVNLPPPGPEPQPTQPAASEVTPSAESAPEIPAEHQTFHVKLGQLRKAAADGEPPQILANMIVALIEGSRLLTPQNPHPLLRELTQEEDLTKLPDALNRFMANIPELSVDAGLQQAIGQALYKYVMGEEFESDDETEETQNADIPARGPSGIRDDADSGRTHDDQPSGPVGQDVDAARPDHENVQAKVA